MGVSVKVTVQALDTDSGRDKSCQAYVDKMGFHKKFDPDLGKDPASFVPDNHEEQDDRADSYRCEKNGWLKRCGCDQSHSPDEEEAFQELNHAPFAEQEG